MRRKLCLLLFVLCNIFMLSRTENQDKWKPFHDEEQTTTTDVKDNNRDSSWDEDRKIADGFRTIIRNTVNRFSTRAPNKNSTLFNQNGPMGLINRPIRRWRLRVRNRRKNVNNTQDVTEVVEIQPQKVEQANEPLKIMPTGLEVVGTAEGVGSSVAENASQIKENNADTEDMVEK